MARRAGCTGGGIAGCLRAGPAGRLYVAWPFPESPIFWQAGSRVAQRDPRIVGGQAADVARVCYNTGMLLRARSRIHQAGRSHHEVDMTELIIHIDDAVVEQLCARVARLGMTLDQYVQHGMTRLLQEPEPTFAELVEELLTEDAELLRRLA